MNMANASPNARGTRRDHIAPACVGSHPGSIGDCVWSIGFALGPFGSQALLLGGRRPWSVYLYTYKVGRVSLYYG